VQIDHTLVDVMVVDELRAGRSMFQRLVQARRA
jgi:hypothetical protein